MPVDSSATPKDKPPATKKSVSHGNVFTSSPVMIPVRVSETIGIADIDATGMPWNDVVSQNKTVTIITPSTMLRCVTDSPRMSSFLVSKESTDATVDFGTYRNIKTKQLSAVRATATGTPYNIHC